MSTNDSLYFTGTPAAQNSKVYEDIAAATEGFGLHP
jgi:hypothetical protein